MSNNASPIKDSDKQVEDNSHPEHGSGIDSNIFLTKTTDSITTDLKACTFKSHWWAKPPQEGNFTDWSLNVRIKDTDDDEEATVTTYLVHRSSLVQGDYFKPIFDGQFLESQQKRSEIEFPTPDITLDHFETLLDYFYSGEIELDSSNAIPILWLSNYLQVTQLEMLAQDHIRNTIEKPLQCDTLFTFYEITVRLQMEQLKAAVAHICAQQPSFMKKDTRFATVPDNAFWCSVWDSRKHDKDQIQKFTEQWSENLANYMDQHNSIVDRAMFSQLTDKDLLPAISPDAAISLMEQEQKFCLEEIGKREVLTCLQHRCIYSLYDKKTGVWNISNKQLELRQTSRRRFLRRLKALPSAVLCALLEQTMKFDDSNLEKLSISVSGAGLACVNGRYDLCSEKYGGKPIFTRFDDTLQQQIMIFCGNGFNRPQNYFYICAVPVGNHPGTFGTIQFQKLYAREVVNNAFCPDLPPENGWKAVRDEVIVRPTILGTRNRSRRREMKSNTATKRIQQISTQCNRQRRNFHLIGVNPPPSLTITKH